MICYVDLEHEQAHQNVQERIEHERRCAGIALRLKRASGDQCLIKHYADFSRQWLDSMAIKALVLGFSVTDWENYDQENLRELRQTVLAAQLPILGLCGGLQFIALAHGARLDPIRRLNEGEKDPSENYATGYFKEWGFTQVEIIKPDPLFDGLEDPSFLEVHYLELKEIPKGFELLASTNACRIQTIKQTGELVYGLQFHPEAYTAQQANHQNWLVNMVYPDGYSEQHSDGRKLLSNFFQLAGINCGA